MPGGRINVMRMIERFGPDGKILYIHFRDVQGTVPTFQECFIGEGNYDPAEVMLALRRVGFDGFLLDDHVPHMDDDSEWQHRGRAHAIGYMQGLDEYDGVLSSGSRQRIDRGARPLDENCIFCRIANGEMGTEFVAQSEHAVAFDDIAPIRSGARARGSKATRCRACASSMTHCLRRSCCRSGANRGGQRTRSATTVVIGSSPTTARMPDRLFFICIFTFSAANGWVAWVDRGIL